MLRKRSRSHQKDQHKGHLMSDAVASDSYFHSEIFGQKQKTHSFFNVPGLFVGFNPKGESDAVRSPTSPLDFRVFSNLGNPFRSPKSTHEGNQKSWDCSKVGLGIIESLENETKPSGKVLRSLDSKNILFGPQMRVKTPNLRTRFDSFEAPKSLPKNYAVFPYAQTKQSDDPQMGNSDAVLFEIGDTPSEREPFGKIRACSLDSKSGLSHLTRLTNCRSSLSSRNVCFENGTNSVSSPSHFIGGNPNLSNSPSTKQTSIPLSIGSGNGFIGSLSASEIELSEDYTCVITHGPNPKTTHIFGDCILECRNNEFTNSLLVNEKQEIQFSAEVPASFPSSDFLSFCYSCKKKLEGEDIYMYRGEKAFCSWSCRSQEILIEEAMENTTEKDSPGNSPKPNSCEDLFETAMFISTT